MSVAASNLWNSAALAAAVGGAVSANFGVSGVAYDSREVGPGDLFIALKGENTDGHQYLEQAFAQGAAGAIVSDGCAHPHVSVGDTAQALDALGKAARTRTQAAIIGVTGSAGKTGTKEALYAALDRCSGGAAHRSVKSYNNHVGVPLSLARMPADMRYGVLEMGMNHPGELSALTQLVRPHVAIVTTIAPAHAGFFKDEAEIADAKGEIFEGLEAGGTAILPFDSPHYARLRAKAEQHAAHIVSFGYGEGADVRVIEAVRAADGGSLVTAQIGDKSLIYTICEPGDHWVSNSLAVLAAVDAVGADLAQAGLALAELDPMPGRGKRDQVTAKGGHALLIDESYNANPASMAATIRELAKEPATRHIAVLGTMRELGEKSAAYHTDLAGPLAEAGVDLAVLVGDEIGALADALASGLAGPKAYVHFTSVTDATEFMQNELAAGDAVLVKGSNAVGLAKLVAALTDPRKEARG